MATGQKFERPNDRRESFFGERGRTTLWHYTTWSGLQAIYGSRRLNPSLRAFNPRDARYGDGQYLSDIPPCTLAPEQLSYALVRSPYASWRFTHYLEVDVTGLKVVRGREHVFVVRGTDPLDLDGRIVNWGANWFGTSR